MKKLTLRIATRKSPLALWQAEYVRQRLLHHWPFLSVDLLPMSTSGDKFLKDKLAVIGNKGLFVKELEEALLNKEADLAVHSMKDVPAFLPEGLAIHAICQREDPHDAFVSEQYSLATLPANAVIGTSSLRRQFQLLNYRPDLIIKPLRGNLQTRLAKLEQGEYSALVLAAAGLKRLNLSHRIQEIFPSDIMLPACGQGALAIECLETTTTIHDLLKPLNDPLSSLCVQAERRVNALLGGNCHVPLAVFCAPQTTTELIIQAKLGTADGKQIIQEARNGPLQAALTLAEECAQALLAKGAANLLMSS